jgi:magnesium-transporting ATPase (P-type)
MNFSLGLLGIFFIVFYYLGVIKKTFSFKRCKEYAAFLLPYLMAWLLFAVIYYFLVIVPRSAPHSGTTLTLNLNLLTMAQFILMAFLGTISKSLALSIFSHPQALLLGILLLLNLIFLVYLLCLYFILNKRRARISLLNDWGVAFFSLGGALLSYAALSLARSNLTADALLNWGRYHYFPYFFLCIFAGNFLPPLFNILSKIFNPSRLKIFAWVILLIFLLIQLISIREKAFSFIKTEGTILKDQPIARHCSPML